MMFAQSLWMNGISEMKYFFIFLLSMIPVFENKGSIVVAAGMRLNWVLTLLVSTLGTAFPVPFVLKFVDRILSAAKKFKFTKNSLIKVEVFKERKAETLKKYGPFSLMFFVSIPFTGIGIWLGCLLASFIGLDYKKTIIALSVASFISGLVATVSAYGLLSLIGFY